MPDDPVLKPALVRVAGLSFRYGGAAPVLRNLDLALRAEDRLGIAGANGCGKSTLLRILMGLHGGWQGSVTLFGQDCRMEQEFMPLRGRIGLLFQDSDDQLFCPTVEEDVAFGPFNQGLTATDVESRVVQALTELDLVHLRHRPIGHLSGGEKRQVALAGLLAMQPEVLLLDEPTTGLDEAARERLIAILLNLRQAMVIVSHERDFLDRVATRRARLHDGVLIELF
ncbi:MAG: ABC transporter ATP-binding protein [Burkholderiales bacterium]|nr:ABC transporter ATP-binding protein [Burkholderiales bacterium]